MIGGIKLDTTLCVDPSNTPAPSSGCPVSNNPAGGPGTNILLAYRLPVGTGAPDTITADASGTPIIFTKDQGYTDSLTAKAAPPSGEKWVGYQSDLSYPNPTTDITLSALFSLPGAHPFQGPFKYRTVVGYRQAGVGSSDAVECADDPTTAGPTTTNGDQSVCIDFPGDGTWQTDDSAPTRDLGIKPGADTSVQQGTSADVPFTAQFAGAADPSATFDLSVASSDAPNGVQFTLSQTTLTPDTDSSTPLTVKAVVPPGTPIGTYSVTVTAKNSAGQERTGTAKLAVVLGKPVARSLPFINGTDAVGQTVTCAPGEWTSSPTSFRYQWFRDGVDVPGATNATYKLTQEDGARLIGCRVVATNAAGDSDPSSSGVVRIAQEGGADVDLSGRPKVTKNSNGTYTVEPGITVSCPPRLPTNCGGSASVGKSGVGISVESGASEKIAVKLSRSESAALTKKGKLTLVGKVATRNHSLERVVSQKRFSVKRPS